MVAMDKVGGYSASGKLFEQGGTQQIGDPPKENFLNTSFVFKQQE